MLLLFTHARTQARRLILTSPPPPPPLPPLPLLLVSVRPPSPPTSFARPSTSSSSFLVVLLAVVVAAAAAGLHARAYKNNNNSTHWSQRGAVGLSGAQCRRARLGPVSVLAQQSPAVGRAAPVRRRPPQLRRERHAARLVCGGCGDGVGGDDGDDDGDSGGDEGHGVGSEVHGQERPPPSQSRGRWSGRRAQPARR